MALLAPESSRHMSFLSLYWLPLPDPGPESYPDTHDHQGLSADPPFLDLDLSAAVRNLVHQQTGHAGLSQVEPTRCPHLSSIL